MILDVMLCYDTLCNDMVRYVVNSVSVGYDIALSGISCDGMLQVGQEGGGSGVRPWRGRSGRLTDQK